MGMLWRSSSRSPPCFTMQWRRILPGKEMVKTRTILHICHSMYHLGWVSCYLDLDFYGICREQSNMFGSTFDRLTVSSNTHLTIINLTHVFWSVDFIHMPWLVRCGRLLVQILLETLLILNFLFVSHSSQLRKAYIYEIKNNHSPVVYVALDTRCD